MNTCSASRHAIRLALKEAEPRQQRVGLEEAGQSAARAADKVGAPREKGETKLALGNEKKSTRPTRSVRMGVKAAKAATADTRGSRAAACSATFPPRA